MYTGALKHSVIERGDGEGKADLGQVMLQIADRWVMTALQKSYLFNHVGL